MIRKMELKDIEQIQEIDKLCFKSDYERISEGIRGYIEASDNSCIVYEEDNKVVGFNFLHIWGSFAWFGAFGVHPKYQGKGIGKEIINYTIKILKEDYKVSTIGLNTMPESQYNVGFYMNIGFTPLKLTLSLKKQISYGDGFEIRDINKYSINEIDINDEKNYLKLKNVLNSISNNIISNLDLSAEFHLIRNENFGGVFTMEAQEGICGIAIYHTKSIRNDKMKNLHIKLAIIKDCIDYKEAVDCIVEFCVKYACNIKYESISIDCNTYNAEICKYLMLEHNFKIQKNMIIMIMGEDNIFKNKNTILLTRLAG